MIRGSGNTATLDVPEQAVVPAQSPFQLGDWVRRHGYVGNPAGPRRWGWRGYVTGSAGATILVGLTDDGRPWAECWGSLGPDASSHSWDRCTCCSRRRTGSGPVQLNLFDAVAS